MIIFSSAESVVSFFITVQVKYVLENCKEDMDFFNTWIEKGIINRLNVYFFPLITLILGYNCILLVIFIFEYQHDG